MSTGVSSTYTPPDNRDHAENHGPVVTALTLCFLVISSILVILRCVSRVGVVKKWSWDDTFIIFAWVRVFLGNRAVVGQSSCLGRSSTDPETGSRFWLFFFHILGRQVRTGSS